MNKIYPYSTIPRQSQKKITLPPIVGFSYYETESKYKPVTNPINRGNTINNN